MVEILNNIGIFGHEIAIEGDYRCYLHLNNEDKIIMICEVNELKVFQYISAKVPTLRKTINEYLSEKVKDDIVNKDKMPLPKFLWDLYIIGIHKTLNENERFNSIHVAEIERDHFVARKIIIEYKDSNELKEKISNVIYPHRQLDGLMKGLQEASNSVFEKLLSGLDSNVVFLNSQVPSHKDVNFEHLTKFMEEVQRVVLPKSGERE